MYGYKFTFNEAYIKQAKRQKAPLPEHYKESLPTKLLLSNFDTEKVIHQLLIAHSPGGMTPFEFDYSEFLDRALTAGIVNVDAAWEKALGVLFELNYFRNKKKEPEPEAIQ